MEKNQIERERLPSHTPCPICGDTVPPDAATRPFCSARCRQIDLGRWLSGNYVISRPVELADLEEE